MIQSPQQCSVTVDEYISGCLHLFYPVAVLCTEYMIGIGGTVPPYSVGIDLPHQPTARSNNNPSRLPLFAYPDGQQSFTIPDLTTSSDLVVQYTPSSSRKRATDLRRYRSIPDVLPTYLPPVPTFLAPTLAVGLFSRVQYSSGYSVQYFLAVIVEPLPL